VPGAVPGPAVPRPEEPRPAVPGAVPGPEARPAEPRPVPGAVPDPEVPRPAAPLSQSPDAKRAAMWERLTPCLCSWADEWADQCNPLDNTLDMPAVTAMWDTLNARIAEVIRIADELDLPKDMTSALEGKLSRQASIMDARIAARLSLKRACFQPVDKARAMPNVAVHRARC